MAITPARRARHRRGRAVTDLVLAPGVLEVGCALAVLAVLPRFGPPTGPPRAAAEAFIRDLEADNLHAGYARLCVSTQQQVTEEQFAADARSRAPVRDHRIVRTSLGDPAGTRAYVEADLTDPAGATERRVFSLRFEGGAWKVCGDPNRVRAPVIR